MKRIDFIAAGAAAAGALLAPGVSSAKAPRLRDVSIQPHLPPNAIVKFEKFKQWTDPMTDEQIATYKIRFTVVPDAFLPITVGARPFITIAPLSNEGHSDVPLKDGKPYELEPWTFVFMTYGASAVGIDDIRKMWQAVEDGTLKAAHCIEGGVPVRFCPSDGVKYLPKMIDWQARYVNADYAIWKKTGVHPRFEDIVAEIGKQ